jgi:hypothetical protein
MSELARSTGPSGQGGGAGYPITLTASAPMTGGTYTWNVSWYGNMYDKSSPFFQSTCSSSLTTNCWKPSTNANHGEEIRSTNTFTVTTPIVNVPESILWYNTGSGLVWDMTTGGTQATTNGAVVYTEPTPAAWSIVGKGDFDGDGVMDYVRWNSSTGEVRIMLMLNTTTVKSENMVWQEPNTAWRIVATGDLNGDKKTDLIWWNNATGQVFAMLMNGYAVSSYGVIWTEPNLNWKIVATGDLNGDGKTDIIWWNSTTGQVFAMLMNGLSVSSSAVIWTEPGVSNWRIAGTGDLNGDGKADLVWRSRSTGSVFSMLMNGLAVSSSGVIWTEPSLNWEIVSIGKYTTSNNAGLLWRNKTTGAVFLLPMNGLSAAPGSSVIWTEPAASWRIEDTTEWRNNAYGVGVTTP